MGAESVSMNRRTVLIAAASIGLGALPIAGATTSYASTPTLGRHETVARRLGPFEVIALLDASGPFFLDQQTAFPEATPADWRAARAVDPGAFGPDGLWQLDFRCFLVRGPRRLTLVDTGVGPVGSPASAWAPVPGRLPDALADIGIEPADIDEVVVTHLHEDHYGWSVGLDGTPLFPKARYVVQQVEVAELAPDDVAVSYVVEPLRRTGQLDVVDGRVRLGSHAPSGGSLSVLPTPGHTPGHQSVLVRGGSERLVLTGDALVHAVQLVNPAVAYAYEADQHVARRTRRRLIAEAADTGAMLGTAHLTRPFVDACR